MTVTRAFVPIYLAVVAWAVVAGFPRLGALLSPAAGAPDTAVHTVLGLAAMLWALAAALRTFRPRPPTDFSRQFAKNHAAVIGMNGALLLGLLTLVTPMIAPFDPIQLDVGPHLAAPSAAHWLGTDEFGRDCLSRCLYGARVSLVIGFVAVSIAASVGTTIGTLAGFYGGLLDRALMWATDLLLSLPRLVLVLALVGVFRPQGATRAFVLVAILGATGWMGVARMVRAQVLSLREQDFVAAARALGVPTHRILLRHLVPNVLAPVIVFASLAVGSTMLAEAALSYLGLGVAPPTATWGALVSEGREVMRTAPWVTFVPGLLIGFAVMSFNLIGDGLRDALDPRLRGRS